MKILFALHSFPPKGKGGTEIYASKLLEQMARGHEVMAFYRESDPFRPDYEVSSGKWRGIPYYAVNYHYRDYRDFSSTYENGRMEAVFREALRAFQPDIVHFHHLTALSTGLPEAARQEGVRGVVLTVHDLWLACAQGQRVRRDLKRCETSEPAVCAACQVMQLDVPGFLKVWPRWVEKFLVQRAFSRTGRLMLDLGWRIHERLVRLFGSRARAQMLRRVQAVDRMLENVDVCLMPSSAIYRQAELSGFPAEKLVLAPKGSLSALSVRRRQPEGVVRIGFLGTLIPSKGPQILMEAFGRFRDPQLRLEFLGPFVPYDGFPDFEPWMKARAARDPRITFSGSYRAEDLPSIFDRLDLVVIPSLWIENRPLVIEEALEAGVPVAASALDSMREQIRDGDNGLLFIPGDPEDLARALQTFLSDPSSVPNPGRAGRKVKSLAEDAEFHLSLYERLAAPRLTPR